MAIRWFGDVRDLKHRNVFRWRERMAANLPLADTFVTTASSTRDLVTEHFPVLGHRHFTIIEHGRDRDQFADIASPPSAPLKVVAFGAFGVSKGTGLLEAMFHANARAGKEVEFHVLGETSGYFRVDFPGVVCHGPYNRDELPDHLRRISPSYALVCSIWPETWCHTLTEAWMSGLPVLASDIGVIAERVGRHGGGRLLDPRRPRVWLSALRELRSPAAWSSLRDEVLAIPDRTISEMSAEYARLYDDLLSRP